MARLMFRRAVPIALALSVLVAAPAAANQRHYPWWWPKPPAKVKDKDDASTAAPATTAVPESTAVPEATVVPAAAAAPVVPAPAPAPPPPPTLGKTVALAAVSGTVSVRAPGGKSVDLTAAVALPTGTRVDTRAGEVELTSALDTGGATQTGRFSGGVFEVRQSRTAKGLTRIVMVGGHWADCGKTSSYVTRSAARKKARKPIRQLWGSDDHGRFQTRGGGSVATVRGTRWLTTDTCDGTRTSVLDGAVSVKSRRTGRTTLVRAGETLFVKR
jgi:hypothetical protein